jgi:CheY-like chemotaxis protein
LPSPASTAAGQDDRPTVLLLDADPAVRRVVRLVLEGAGYSCVTAEAPDDARRLVSQFRPALVLADLPQSATIEDDVRHVMGAEGWRPRFALMSAYPRRRRGPEDYFIRKPIEFDRLLSLLDAIEHGTAG